MDNSNNINGKSSRSLTPEEIKGYVEGTLSAEEKRRVEELLVDSPMDAEAVEGYEMLGPEAAERLVADINKDIDVITGAGREIKVRTIAPIRWMAAASVLVLMGFGAWYFGNQLGNHQDNVSLATPADEIKTEQNTASEVVPFGQKTDSTGVEPARSIIGLIEQDDTELNLSADLTATRQRPVDAELDLVLEVADSEEFFPMDEPAQDELPVAEQSDVVNSIPKPANTFDLGFSDDVTSFVANSSEPRVTAPEAAQILDATSNNAYYESDLRLTEMEAMEDEEMLLAAGDLSSGEFGNIDVDSFVFQRLNARTVADFRYSFSSNYDGAGGIVQGRITDFQTGEPLIGAVIQAKGTDYGVMTDFDGYYELKLPVGRHDLEIRYVGYDKLGEPIIIVEGEQRMLDASLDASALALDEVVVASEKASRAKDRKQFSKEEISSRAPAAAEPAYMKGGELLISDDADDIPDDSYARGYKAMQQQDSVTAFKWMQTTLQERPYHPEAALYSGLILLQSQRPTDALSYLEPLIARNPGEEIVAEARWYQALSYLALRNREAAEPILLSIEEKGGEYSRDATLTLEDLGW